MYMTSNDDVICRCIITDNFFTLDDVAGAQACSSTLHLWWF